MTARSMSLHAVVAACALAALAGCKNDAEKAADAAATQVIKARSAEAAKLLCAGSVAAFTSSYMTEEAGNAFGKAIADAFDDGYKSAHPILGRAAATMSQRRKLQLIEARIAKSGASICTLESVGVDALSGQNANVVIGVKFKSSDESLSMKWESTAGTWLIMDAGDVQDKAVERMRIAAAKS